MIRRHSIDQFVLQVNDTILIFFLDDKEIGLACDFNFIVTIGDQLLILAVDDCRFALYGDHEVFIIVET